MPTQRSFGQRAAAQPEVQEAKPRTPIAPPGRTVEPAADAKALLPPDALSIDDELREWKKARAFQIPWRQLSVMAGLCFTVASLVLPDSVNDLFDWLLYVLAAAAFYAGLRKRKKT